MDRRTRTRRAALLAGAGALVLAGALAVIGTGSDPADAVAEPAERTEAAPAGPGSSGGWTTDLGEVPQQLLDDLAALRELPAGQQPAALADIRDRAADGTYGDTAQRVVDGLPDALVPPGVRAELEALAPTGWDVELDDLRGIDPGEPVAALAQIRDEARDGDLGGDAQQWAERIDEAQEWAGRLGSLADRWGG